ncbi:MAG: dihydrolipoamide acetyltransferase family protein [Candidatus Ranarchaeia archaeon]
MVSIVRLPKFGETMIEGTITKWLKHEGDPVKKGDPLYEVETEKLTSDVENITEGVLLKILVPEGNTIPVGAPIAVIGYVGEKIPVIEKRPQVQREVSRPSISTSVQDRIKISPIARKLAREYNIELTMITGTGPGGRITRNDVEKYVNTLKKETKIFSVPYHVLPLTPMRKTIIKNLMKSVQSTVHITINREINCDPLVAYRTEIIDQFVKEHGFRVTFTDILMKLVLASLKQHPLLNATLADDGIHVYEVINLGIAVGQDKGLIVPVIHNAHEKSLVELAEKRRDLVHRTKTNKLAIKDVSGGTFTFNNLGMYGVDTFTPILRYPQSSILGIGRIRRVPVIEKDTITIGYQMTLSLTIDHRVLDGSQAAEFLETLDEKIREPMKICRFK